MVPFCSSVCSEMLRSERLVAPLIVIAPLIVKGMHPLEEKIS